MDPEHPPSRATVRSRTCGDTPCDGKTESGIRCDRGPDLLHVEPVRLHGTLRPRAQVPACRRGDPRPSCADGLLVGGPARELGRHRRAVVAAGPRPGPVVTVPDHLGGPGRSPRPSAPPRPPAPPPARRGPRHGPRESTSSHGFALGDVRPASTLDRLPRELLVYAVEAADTGFDTGLSPQAAAAVEPLIQRIVDGPVRRARADQ
ncbi:hypothetical protein ACH4Q6_30220 [Streptomyces lydicus]|uniref:hypothetical protein n=1 Tax=Streptomyces lydicus TaxID=47763 RepID=UPI003791FB92